MRHVRKNACIIYSTVDGQTKKICDVLSANLKSKFNVKVININESNSKSLQKSDIIILGASIRYGKHRLEVYDFVEKNKYLLTSKKSAFFTVNVVARKKEKNTPETNPYMMKFLEKSKWKPHYLAVFAGKIDYPALSLFDRYIIKFIMWLTKGPTNMRKAYEFTNWNKVQEFANLLKEETDIDFSREIK